MDKVLSSKFDLQNSLPDFSISSCPVCVQCIIKWLFSNKPARLLMVYSSGLYLANKDYIRAAYLLDVCSWLLVAGG